MAARVLVGIAQGDGSERLHEMIDALAGVVFDAPAVVLAEGLLEQPEDRCRFARATELAAIVLGVSESRAAGRAESKR